METLVITSGRFEGASFPLTSDQMTIGRVSSCDVRLPDISVSRRHARIERTSDGLVLLDLGSLNGTYVAGERVQGSRVLSTGDLIKIGDVCLEYRAAEAAVTDPEDRATRRRIHLEAISHFQTQVGNEEDWRVVTQALCQTVARLVGGVARVQAVQELERRRFIPFVVNSQETLRPLPSPNDLVKALKSGKAVRLGRTTVFVPCVHRSASPIRGLHLIQGPFSDDDISVAEFAVEVALQTPAYNPTYDPGGTLTVDSPALTAIIGEDARMLKVKTEIVRAAATSVPVLVLGESGTGKELVARAIHTLSPRSDERFLALNCAGLPPELIDSELFGHEKGSFTGAMNRHQGLFEQAGEGTLFLDEVAELPLAAQAKLLRTLDSGEYRRVGGSEVLKARARILCATNRNLEKMIEDGSFRLDLYYRIAGYVVDLPALRERRQDIPKLVMHFLEVYAQRENLPVPEVSPAAMSRLLAHSWPGNVREVEMLIRRLASLKRTEPIRPDEIPLQDGAGAEETSAQEVELISLKEQEKRHILAVLEACGHNKLQAAKVLGIARATLYEKLRAFGV